VSDQELRDQVRAFVRKIKRGFRYVGTHGTDDLVNGLILRWLESGEYERLKNLPAGERKIGLSIRRFIIDQLRGRDTRREGRTTLVAQQLLCQSDEEFEARLLDVEFEHWLHKQLKAFDDGSYHKLPVSLSNPPEIASVLRLKLLHQRVVRDIATQLGLSIGTVQDRIQEGVGYLAALYSVDFNLSDLPKSP
jgi:DNA-directed RNA polymerase specialized sigma24 family protein